MIMTADEVRDLMKEAKMEWFKKIEQEEIIPKAKLGYSNTGWIAIPQFFSRTIEISDFFCKYGYSINFIGQSFMIKW